MRDPFGELPRLAAQPDLLVAVDYDGTLAPIVEDPAAAVPQPGAMEAVAALAGTPGTAVAIVSGRALEELARLTGAPREVRLVGSHGGEPGETRPLSPAQRRRLEEVRAGLEELAARVPGVEVEPKPAGAALHYRRADRGREAEVVEAVERGPGGSGEVEVRHGKKVVELSVAPADKGGALDDLRRAMGAPVVVYLGDDVTDEDAFAVLGENDLAVKVGEGESAAPYRLGGPPEVVRFLAALAEARGA